MIWLLAIIGGVIWFWHQVANDVRRERNDRERKQAQEDRDNWFGD